MNLIKKFIFPLISLFLIYNTIELVKHLLNSEPGAFSLLSLLLLAFLLNLYITGAFAFPGFAFPTNKILSDKYYELKNPKKLKWIYKIMGVRYFAALILILFWGRKKNRKKFFDGTRRGLTNFIYQSKQSEFGHLGAYLFVLIASIVLLLHGYLILVAIMTLINIIGNLYPIILQRYHRIRIERLTKHYVAESNARSN